MGANVRADFGPSFLLDEERLRRLHQKISERAANLRGIFDFEYRVLRADTYSYTTQNVDDILVESNAGHERLLEINILSRKDSEIDYYLSFNQSGAILRIDGNDRDTVFLLFSDVREYILSSIVKRDYARIFTSRFFAKIIPFIFGIALLTFLYSYSSRDLAPTASDLDAKVEFLVSQQIMINAILPYIFGFMAFVMILMSSFDIIPSVITRIWPSCVFLIGGEIARYEKRKRIQERVFWGGVVAFFVSVLAGLLSGIFLN